MQMRTITEYINESVMSIDDKQRKAVYALLKEIKEDNDLQDKIKCYKDNEKTLLKFFEALSYWV